MLRHVVAAGVSAFLVSQALPAAAQTSAPTPVTAKTEVLDEETITGGRMITLPTPPVAPIYYTLPMTLKIVQDSSITTNTPVTDKLGTQYAAWAEALRACSLDKAKLVRVVEDKEVPFIVGETEGKVKLNANNKPVCSVE